MVQTLSLMDTAFTIVTNSYLPNAMVLGKSLMKHNPKTNYLIFIIDKLQNLPRGYINKSNFEILEVESLNISELENMLKKYTAFEMSCALKPFLAEYILNNYDTNKVIYLDSDILVFNSFRELDSIDNCSILLTPHCLFPTNRDDGNVMDLKFLNYGVFNAGFFVCYKYHEETLQILNWWKGKLFDECYTDLINGRFVDQIWLNLLPVYFNNVYVYKNLGYNVAPWNLCERNIIDNNNYFFINNFTIPLVFFHFSGFDYKNPDIISFRYNEITFDNHPELVPIYNQYINNLKDEGIVSFTEVKYSYYIKPNQIIKHSIKTRIKKKIISILERI